MIIIDKHEKNSPIVSELIEMGSKIELKHLPVADYLIGDTAIERKTVSDFLNSMLNKRLIRQLQEMKQYPKQLLIIEGIEHQEIYSDQKPGIHPNAIRGFLLSILLGFQIPIIFTKDYRDTANFLIVLDKKQEKGVKEISLNAKKKARNISEQQQFILESFPGIGPSTAKKLLKKYGTIKTIINTPIEELKKEIGKKGEIFKLLDKYYV